jgi:hypothetical protein
MKTLSGKLIFYYDFYVWNEIKRDLLTNIFEILIFSTIKKNNHIRNVLFMLSQSMRSCR